MVKITNLEIKSFGVQNNQCFVTDKINILKKDIDNLDFYLVIAGTNTSQVKGISAAGIDPKSRKKTALADAEFLLHGPSETCKYKLPILGAGVTPALISYVCAKLIKADVTIIPIGICEKPYFKHLSIEQQPSKPSNCLSTGKSMSIKRVTRLLDKGFSIGNSSKKPIFISESVPGGTTTAQAVMEVFGLNVGDLVGSSLKNPPRELKRKLISEGISNANFKSDLNSINVLAALGDPFQAFSMGLLIGARNANKTVILSGGSQMVAVLLLALEYIEVKDKQRFVDKIFLVTTGWLVRDDSLNRLMNLIADKHKVSLIGLASCLNFKSSKYNELKDYEIGYVKEGVGAGGMSLITYLKGFSYEIIKSQCELNLKKMHSIAQIQLKS